MSGRSLSDSRVRWLAFVLSFACYASVGYWLQVRHGFIIGDSLARVEAAQSVLFSRSPHVAAIGFIPEGKRPQTAMAWLILILFVPFLGLVIYLFLGTP